MKWLKEEAYNAMNQAADNWNKLLNKVLADNPDMKAEDVTPDQLLEAFESGGAAAELQEQLTTAQDELTAKDTQIEQLQSDVAELRGTPVVKKPTTKVNNEPTATEADIKDFAEKHEGDTLAIMAEAEKNGFFKHN